MTTTLTPNLGLIKPGLKEKIKPDVANGFEGWASQNADNCDTIDEVFRLEVSAREGEYIPFWSASSVNPTIGSDGFIIGHYIRIWPNVVFGWVILDVGTAANGFDNGSGVYRISPPPVDFTSIVANPQAGIAFLRDAGGPSTNSQLMEVKITSLGLTFGPNLSSFNSRWGDDIPFVLEESDRMSCYFTYFTDDP